MKVVVSFDGGLTEITDRFLVVYRNRFGSPMFAGQNYDDLVLSLNDLKALLESDEDDPIAGMFDYS